MGVSNKIFVLFLGLVVALKAYLFFSIPKGNSESLLLYRAYSLSRSGLDERGVLAPRIFSSPEGYQLPVTSYLLALISFLLGSGKHVGFVFETAIVVLLWISFKKLFESRGSAMIILSSPLILWPGNWEGKLLALLILLLIYLLEKGSTKIGSLLGMIFLILLTSPDGLLLVPLIFLSYFLVRRITLRLLLRNLIVYLFCAFVAYEMFVPVPAFLANYASSQFGVLLDSSSINTINMLRGEDWGKTNPVLSRLLHNKTQLIEIIFANFLSGVNPSYVFGLGDKDVKSNSLWIGVVSIAFIPYLMKLFAKKDKDDPLRLALVGIALLVASFKKSSLSETDMLPFVLFFSLLIGRIIDASDKKLNNLLFVLCIFLTLIAAKFSANLYNKDYLYRSDFMIEHIGRLSKNYPDKLILVSDDIYPDPGPGIALISKYLPQREKGISYSPRYFLRKIGNLEIVSPFDERLKIGTQANPSFDESVIRVVSLRDILQYQSDLNTKVTRIINDPLGKVEIYRIDYKHHE